jgi:hypothetical protein
MAAQSSRESVMRARKRLAIIVCTLAFGFASLGVLHMPFARGLLMRAGGCPVGHARLAEIEPARLASLAALRGGLAAAPARPALGFELDRTTPREARAWAERARVTCAEVREGLVRCENVPARALGLPESDGPVGELYLGFNTRARLVDVSTMRTHLAQAGIVRDVEGKLVSEVGAPHQKSGSFDEAHLSLEGAQGLSSVRYRYRDYFADVIAMRFTTDGLVLREHYMSAND